MLLALASIARFGYVDRACITATPGVVELNVAEIADSFAQPLFATLKFSSHIHCC